MERKTTSSEAELRLHRCCFTGHRPEKLSVDEMVLRNHLENAIRLAFQDGFCVFLSGMARGTDIIGAEIVLRLRSEGFPVKLVAALPYPGFESSWSRSWQMRYHAILRDADLVSYISGQYSRDCFQRRNTWMVDRSNLVISVYNGTPGGTRNTIEYAKKNDIRVVNALEL